MVASFGCSPLQGGSLSKTIIPEAGSTFSSPEHPAALTLSVEWGLSSRKNPLSQ